jgi:hypothetical protein
MHYGASRLQNVTALYVMLGWDWYGFDKKRVGPRCGKLVFLHPVDLSVT